MKNQKLPIIAAVVVIALVAIIALSSSMFVTIDAGYKGVVFRKFGGGLDKENVYGQGFHMIAPWNSMYTYDVRIQEKTEEMDVLASNGLDIHIDLSFRYSAEPSEIGHLHDEIGLEYAEKIVIPEIRSATRKVIGKYLPEELYSSKREVIQTEIYQASEASLNPKHVHLDAVLIRSVKLPPKIAGAIQLKLEQQQQKEEYEFRIQKEQKEAERKRIEAQGIKDFQDIVSEGISDKLLKWKGIEATQDLAKSNNTKIIVIGSGQDDLPIILGGN